jgi:putative ABC transport system permease protein
VEGTVEGPGTDRQKIGRQIVLPMSKAFEIAWKGIRIRIWRSLITMSGIILAIAFLMSVWTSGVLTQSLRDVPAEDELYPLVRGTLEAEALESGGARIHCVVVEKEAGRTAAGQISPGASIQRLLNAQGRFRAEPVPADADALLGILEPESATSPDVVVLIGFPPALADPGISEALGRFVDQGGFLLVYGADGSADALESLLPATASGDAFTPSAQSIRGAEHLAARGIPWERHPEARFLGTEGKSQATPLANSDGRALAWLADHGQGSVAWYPLTEQSGDVPDVISWFLRGQGVNAAGEGDPNSALLVKLIAHGASEKLLSEGADRRGTWLVALSLMVCVVGITNAMLMSVTERFREIGTMKCLGALDSFVVKLFLIESSLQGVVGSLTGALVGFLVAFAGALFTFHVRDLETGRGYWLVLRFLPSGDVLQWFFIALVVGVVLSVVAAIYPALRAARMQPVEAMRGEG